MENLEIYNAARSVPEEAKKPISAGRLKGFTDIQPMWRIKTLTEMFGPCGVGWYYKVTSSRIEEGAGGEKAAFVEIELYIKVDGEWSMPIHGTGGSMLIASEKSGLHTSDEAFKMAETDAISVACKNLGFAADVYWGKDRTKYRQEAPDQKAEPKREDGVELAKLRTKIMSYINRHQYTQEQIEKICASFGKKSLNDFGIEECQQYIAFITSKGGNIDE